MKLTDMKPKQSKFKLKQVEKELTLRPISLDDEIWLKEIYGDDGIQEVFENVNIEEISRIAFRLLITEDKKLFKIREVTVVDENGEEGTFNIGGVKLLRTLIFGWEEKLVVLNALLENIGYSRPEVEETPKKKAKIAKKIAKKAKKKVKK